MPEPVSSLLPQPDGWCLCFPLLLCFPFPPIIFIYLDLKGSYYIHVQTLFLDVARLKHTRGDKLSSPLTVVGESRGFAPRHNDGFSRVYLSSRPLIFPRFSHLAASEVALTATHWQVLPRHVDTRGRGTESQTETQQSTAKVHTHTRTHTHTHTHCLPIWLLPRSFEGTVSYIHFIFSSQRFLSLKLLLIFSHDAGKRRIKKRQHPIKDETKNTSLSGSDGGRSWFCSSSASCFIRQVNCDGAATCRLSVDG